MPRRSTLISLALFAVAAGWTASAWAGAASAAIDLDAPIPDAGHDNRGPLSITSDGQNFLVVWTDYRGGYSSELDGPFGQLQATRVSPSGVVLDHTGIRISPTIALRDDQPIAGFDGQHFVIGWKGRYYIYENHISVEYLAFDGGTPTLSGTVEVTPTNAGYYINPGMAVAQSESLFVYTFNRNVYAARVLPDGGKLDPGGIALTNSGTADEAAATYDGTGFSWRGKRAPTAASACSDAG